MPEAKYVGRKLLDENEKINNRFSPILGHLWGGNMFWYMWALPINVTMCHYQRAFLRRYLYKKWWPVGRLGFYVVVLICWEMLKNLFQNRVTLILVIRKLVLVSWLCTHSSEPECLCLMKWPSKTFQNLPYYFFLE